MQKLLEKLDRVEISDKFWKQLPETAGVYVFYKNSEVLYIGKAINLKRRVSSYFDLDLEPKTASMISQAGSLGLIQVGSELDALLLEARLIRHYMPRYNIVAKDDKHPLYIRITKEKYPRVLMARKIAENDKNLAFYGPFPSGANVRAVLKLVRRIFPFSDHKISKRACLYSHIGLCNPCPNIIEESPEKDLLIKKYSKNIRHIRSILDGNIDKVVRNIKTEMEINAKSENFEEAARLRNKINQLEYITRPQLPTEYYLENPNFYEDNKSKELNQLSALLFQKNVYHEKLDRIECFDIAHLAGSSPTASMVTFVKGEADKTMYRHFKINKARGGDDYGSLGEVAGRRKNHFSDWGKPDLIVVDGGIGQVKSFNDAFNSIGVTGIPIVGIAKHPDRLIIGKEKSRLTGAALNLVSRMRDEAHRFARRYHHKLVSKSLINGSGESSK